MNVLCDGSGGSETLSPLEGRLSGAGTPDAGAWGFTRPPELHWESHLTPSLRGAPRTLHRDVHTARAQSFRGMKAAARGAGTS